VSYSRRVGKVSISVSDCRVVVTTLLLLFLLSLAAFLAACSKSEQQSHRAFASPDRAGNGLLKAEKSGDPNQLLAIVGPGSREMLFSGDSAQDKARVDAFVADYGVIHRWRRMSDGTRILITGADNFGFQIPLRRNDSGSSTRRQVRLRF
jgi:hypothetical protein